MSKVEFFHGTTLIGTDTISPYSINWSNVQAASYSLTAKATAIKKNNPDQTATSSPVNITVTAPNVPPSVSLTSPVGGATFNAPASITLTASASDSDGTITKVEFFHGGTTLIATVTTPPYSVIWSSVPQAAYTLTAVATDNQLASTASSPVNVSVGPPVPQMYFIHTDHLNTPRLVANAAGQTVWLWHQGEPFGNNLPDENPSGLGAFAFPLRFPGQYADPETGIFYNYFRDYDAALGRYIQSDPIGLDGGLNIYAYVRDPQRETDRYGLMGSRELTPEQKEQLCKKNGWPTKPDPCATQDQCFETAEEWLAVRCKKAKGKWGLPFGNVVEQAFCRYCWTLYSKECPGKTPDRRCNQNACLPMPTPTAIQARS